MPPKKNSKESGDDINFNVNDLTKIISDTVKAENNILLKKITELEDRLSDMSVTNQQLLLLLQTRHCKCEISCEKSGPNKEIEDDMSDLETSDDTIISIPIDKQAEKPQKTSTNNEQKKNLIKSTKPINTRKDAKKTANIRGTLENATNFKATSRKLWLHVGRCDKDTTVNQIKKHVNEIWKEHRFEVEKLSSKGSNASFRVSVDYHTDLIQTLYDPNCWPNGIVVKQFKFFRTAQKSTGVFSK